MLTGTSDYCVTVHRYQSMVLDNVRRYPFFIDGKPYSIDPDFVYAIIWQESRGNPNAKSRAGALGLMQMMPQTARILHCPIKTLRQPQYAIRCGVRFLAALLTYNRGNMVKTLAGYNGGTWNVEHHPTHRSGILAGKVYDNPETRRYVSSVLKWYELFRQCGDKAANRPSDKK